MKMKKFVSGLLLSSLILNGAVAPALANYNSMPSISAENVQNYTGLLIKNHCQYLCGNEQINNNSIVKSKLTSIEKNAEKALSVYQGTANPYVLFNADGYDMSDSKTVDALNSDAFYKNSQYIYDICLAYSTFGTKYYHDEQLKQTLLDCLNAFYTVYNSHTGYVDKQTGRLFGNWWNWEIGVPTKITSVLAMLQTEVQNTNPELIKLYIEAFDNHLRTGKNGDVDLTAATHTGTNLIDITANRIIQGALTEDSKRIEKAVNDMMTVFDTIDPYNIVNNNTDGVYADGSFIQHHRVAYTGSYGKLLLQKAVSSLYILSGTPWQPASKVSTIENWIYNSFLPLMHEGYMSEVVKGRAVSRSNTGYSDSVGVIEAMTLLTTFLSDSNSLKMKEQIKYVIDSMPVEFSQSGLNLPAIEPYTQIINDKNIKAVNHVKQGAVAFNAMDRNLQLNDKFTFALSRSSDRIAKYEYMSGENLKPWFQGDGAYYLYLSGVDQTKQYGVNYFTTVNPYRLAGTTVPNEQRKTIMELYNGSQFYPEYPAGSTEQNDYVYFPVGTNDFSGSVTLKDYGVSMAGMQLGDDNGYTAKQNGILPDDFVAYKNANGNKSWFIMNDKIVFVGSDIDDDLNRDVTTTIDNRMSDENAKLSITAKDSNNKTVSTQNGVVDNLKWLNYNDTSLDTNIGYYFPKNNQVTLSTEVSTQNQKDIRNVSSQKDNIITQKYFTMTFEHGKTKDSTYSYVVIPNADAKQMENYASNPDVTIVENSKNIHAVRDDKNQTLAMNFFEAGQSTGVKSDSPVSVLMKKSDNTVTIALSDPLFKQKEIKLVLDIKNASIASADERITAKCNADNIELTLNADKLYGQSVEITLNTDDNNEAMWGNYYQNPFTDVSENSWYYNAVKYVNQNGIINGISNDKFAPDANTSRAMIAQILYNMANKPSTSANNPFTDVKQDAWYANAINWAYQNNIVSGTTEKTFSPDENITREALAVILYRYSNSPKVNANLDKYKDASNISSWAKDAFAWAIETGLITGMSDNTLNPRGNATRAQVATIIERLQTK